jgi:hypothetical protein
VRDAGESVDLPISAFTLHRAQVLTTSDEMNIGATDSEAGTEVPTESAGTHHCDFH